MAVVDFINTFRIQADQPIDSRFVLEDEAARFAYPTGALYEGLLVYQVDTKVLWTLTDVSNKDNASGWSRETSDDIVSITASDVKSNGYRDLVFTFESGKVITIENAFKEAEKGDKGDTGATGARGQQGATGATGIGVQGPGGPAGAQGPKGDTGDIGLPGAEGPQGPIGPGGGEKGDKGDPGAQGPAGQDGTDGINGINGTDGTDGAPGPQGEQGLPGTDGSDANVTKTNVDLALEVGDSDEAFYYNNDGVWVVIPDPTKTQIDDAIGATGTAESTRFYAEDGQFRTPAGGGSGGTVYYDDVVDIPIQRNRLVNIFTVTGTRGNIVPAGSNDEFAVITFRNDYDPGVDGVFTFIPDVTFQAYGFSALFSQPFTGSTITEYITQVGNEAAGLSELITWDGVITATTLDGVAASRIRLDMGVSTPISSAFSLVGTNPETTIDNESAGGFPATSIRILLGGVEVFTFNASALGANDNNTNFIGTTAATGITNVTQFPVNWQAEYQNNTNQQEIVITSDVAGEQPVWSFVVDNNGLTGAGAGNIGFTGPTFDTVQANLIDIVTFPDGSSFTSANTGGGDLFVNITKGGTFLMSDGTKLPSGTDATDTRGNSNARWNTVEYNNTTYYWIQEVGLPKASIIRIDNITDGTIVASKTY